MQIKTKILQDVGQKPEKKNYTNDKIKNEAQLPEHDHN